MARLSDTEALARKGLKAPGAKVAPFGGDLAHERGADNVVQERNSGAFRRETSAGGESLFGAKAELED